MIRQLESARHLELKIQELEKRRYEIYYDYQKESDNHNNNRKNYPLRMDEWSQIRGDIFGKYYKNIKEVEKEINYFKKELEEKNKMLEVRINNMTDEQFEKVRNSLFVKIGKKGHVEMVAALDFARRQIAVKRKINTSHNKPTPEIILSPKKDHKQHLVNPTSALILTPKKSSHQNFSVFDDKTAHFYNILSKYTTEIFAIIFFHRILIIFQYLWFGKLLNDI
jgi:hypothetical protein